MKEETRTVLIDLPTTVNGFVIGKDDPTVILNSRMTHEMNKETFWHELDHIDTDAFEGDDVQLIEYLARKGKA